MKFSVEKRQQYDKDMITERDWENIKQTARREGRAEERLAVAKNLKALDISIADIAKATGLTLEEAL